MPTVTRINDEDKLLCGSRINRYIETQQYEEKNNLLSHRHSTLSLQR
jgi:hypothetical protein